MQIVSALKKQKAGISTPEIFRELGVTEATFYNWKAKYGGIEHSDVKKMENLEEENARLKKMYADLAIDNQILKDLFTKKRLGPATKRQLAEELVRDQDVPASRACKLVCFSRSQFYYSSKRDDKELMDALQELVLQIPRMDSESCLHISEGLANPGTIKR